MKIDFERTGGFAGIKLILKLDTRDLLPEDGQVINKLVSEADFFKMKEPEIGKGIPDGFQYLISIEHDDLRRTIKINDGALPLKLQPLVNDLSIRARTRKRPK